MSSGWDQQPLFEVRNLKKHYPITKGVLRKEVGRVKAVDGISFDLFRSETLGLVGESGCGKSTAATSMIRLEEPTSGEIRFDGDDISQYDDEELKLFRRKVQMIFQDPESSFDPRMSVGQSLTEPLAVQGFSDRQRRKQVIGNLLERVGLSAGDATRYPHEFSGGQKQRIALARALTLNPEVIIADEPVSALDVSIQAEILRLMKDIQEEYGLSIVVISHDMGVIRQICDRVAVMYLGEIVEMAPTEELFEDPQHPYTRALLSSIPTPDPRQRGQGIELTGDVPSPANPPEGCRFHTRCPEVIQPVEYDMDQEEWRHVIDFLTRLQDGKLDLDSVKEMASTEADIDIDDVDADLLAVTMRDELKLPEALTDPDADAVVTDAIDRVIDERPEEALGALKESFQSPCMSDVPDEIDLSRDHRVSCHLHDEQAVANRPTSTTQSGQD